MAHFILANFVYPEQDVFQASFQLQFVIDVTGKLIAPGIQNKQPARYTNAEKELLRVLSIMPKWRPGECRGKKVPVKVMLPLRF
ncbi:hypothetical protein F0L74_21730 [Chitinophaga agrisoli]|uniref:TonB-like protein n=1 Tax=Chitinophaga agrisoli TaxID=2607653 RepID=A0A5B2VJK2_9BACT|nr:hypothetical protein [Chitinophaga agrisoli]KAA2238838.1 hypothetical protein F0L74_21730 [Chitinophaga agrisoli]